MDVFDSGFGVGLEPPLEGGFAAAVEYNVACTGLGVCLRDAESYTVGCPGDPCVFAFERKNTVHITLIICSVHGHKATLCKINIFLSKQNTLSAFDELNRNAGGVPHHRSVKTRRLFVYHKRGSGFYKPLDIGIHVIRREAEMKSKRIH